MKKLLILLLAACWFSPAAMAQITHSETRVQQNGVHMPKGARYFVRDAMAANQFEIIISQLALNKSQNTAIRTFAEEMIKDHAQADQELQQAIQQGQFFNAPSKPALAIKQETLYRNLQKLDGSAFDDAYLNAQMNAHQETIALFQSYANIGTTPVIKGFAVKMLPALRVHQGHLHQIAKGQ